MEQEREAFEAWWQTERQRTWNEARIPRDSLEPPPGWSSAYKSRCWITWQARAAIAAQQAAPTEQLSTAMDVTLDQAACELLYSMLAPSTPDDDQYSEVRLQFGDGHSGHGLYVSLAEYPEEGSELLAAAPRAQQAAQPLAWVRFCSDGTYEGPLMDSQMEDVRKKSGAWTPLYAAPQER